MARSIKLEKKSILKSLLSVDTIKIGLMGAIAIVMIIAMFAGYTITTQFVSISKNDSNKKMMQFLVKIKAQSNYTIDMKDRILKDLGQLYEDKLTEYCEANCPNVTAERIMQDVKYYRLIVMQMNDACEQITIYRYIYDNDLYRYTNINDWKKFKANVVELYVTQGRKTLLDNYDNSKVIMPVHIWMKLAGRELVQVITENTDKLLEDLKTESVIFYNLK